MTKITGAKIYDLRFPTSESLAGSDAMYQAPDYSAAYLVLQTDHTRNLEGQSLIFSLGRGNELCTAAIRSLLPMIIGKEIEPFFANMGAFSKLITSDTQLRWLGPEKGVGYMAAGAIINALWDLYAKKERKPLWQLLAEMNTEDLVACMNFSYISDVITPSEAIDLLNDKKEGKEARIEHLLTHGHPAYTTSAGWMGYSDDTIESLCREASNQGWKAVKMKVGANLQDDIRRAELVRKVIGNQSTLLMDANEVWSVGEAIEWMEQLKQFEPYWIEEPTSPDDILGHARIRRAVAPVKVATGEVCHNRVMFKQFFQAKAIDVCQLDSVRMAGITEVLTVLMLALKFDIPVCPHGGGVGLCELAQHIGMLDYISFAGTMEGRMIEYVDHLHEHFVHPVQIRDGKYLVPKDSGYSVEIKSKSLETFQLEKIDFP